MSADALHIDVKSRGGRVRLLLAILHLFLIAGAPVTKAAAAHSTEAFDQANKLYEQGKFPEAVAAYDAMVARGVNTPGLWFNLGNAAYKAGLMGRAVAAYRLAERITPRDAALRANLQFVRSKIYTDERTRLPYWKTLFRLATINEWTWLTAICFWISFLFLAGQEVSRQRFPKTLLLLLALTILSGVGLCGALRDQKGSEVAIVTAREVTARFGPLDDSQAKFQLRDGAEVTVVHTKGQWLEINDPEKRTGWIRRDEIAMLPSVFSVTRSQQAAP